MWQDGPRERAKGAPRLYGMRIDLGLIVSNDGIHFREPVPDFKVIAHGKEGEWDSISLLQGHAFANVGEKTYIWYSHWDSEEQFRNEAIGLATLRRDGFGYLSHKVAAEDAHCITANLPAAEHGYRLQVNVEGVTPKSPLTVELLNRLGQALPGFSGKDAARVTEPGVQREVVWSGDAARRGTVTQSFAVRVNFPQSSDARLYAVYATRLTAERRTP